ncbi:MAG: ABC transporter permease [Acetatifactor sp.]
MKNIVAVFLKQICDTMKNKAVLIQYVMFPMMTVIMENAVTIEGMPRHFFVKMFAAMFIGMAPLVCMSSIVSEEKEKNTLRVFMMSNVRPWEYLIGIGVYVFGMCMLGTAVFAAVGEYRGNELWMFMAVMAAGILLSELTGAVIGICSANQMAATSVTVPVMMIMAFLPMLSMFNDGIDRAARITYAKQISDLINGIGISGVSAENIIVTAVNFAIVFILFVFAYQKRGLE